MRTAEYVWQREGEYFVSSTRVTLRSIVANWKRGRTPEQIAADFPSVPLVAIYGAITTYLEEQPKFERHFAAAAATATDEKAATEAAHAAFYADMRARLAQVRPQVQAELRAHGLLPDDEGTSDTPASSPSQTPTA